jgi:hypothetical protein
MSGRNVASIVAALAFVSGVAQAQMTDGMRTVSFGIMAGANFAKVGGEDAEGVSNRTGLVGGVFVDMPVANAVSIRPELLYSMQGAKVDDIDGKGTDGKVNLNYIALPVLVRVTVPTASQTRPFFALGPSFAFQTKCELEAGGESISCDDAGGGQKSFDVGAKAEAGVDFGMNGRVFTVGAGYTHGFSKLFEDDNVKSRVISIFAALGF